jgi:hypothetical protein
VAGAQERLPSGRLRVLLLGLKLLELLGLLR